MSDIMHELKSSSRSITREDLETNVGIGNIKYKVHVRHSTSKNAPTQTVFILNNGGHACTCMYLVNSGVLCRHFWKFALVNPNLSIFSSDLIAKRWLKE